METYHVKLTNRALQDLDGIYTYIAKTLQASNTALSLIKRIEDGILSLAHMPYRCPERKRGIYANRGYRQLFIKNYTVIYRIHEQKKEVIIVTVRYSPSNF